MAVVAVDIVYHFLRTLDARLLWFQVFHVTGQVALPGRISHLINIVRVHEAHGIPVGVASPVLPVLYHCVDRNLQFTVFVEHADEFIAGLIAFATLPEAHGPQGRQCSLSREFTYGGDDAVGRAVAIEKVVVDKRSHLTAHRRLRSSVVEQRASGIVPIEPVAFAAEEERNRYICVVVPHLHLLSAVAHERVTKLSESIYGLVAGQSETLSDLVLSVVHLVGARCEETTGGLQQFLAFVVGKGNIARP